MDLSKVKVLNSNKHYTQIVGAIPDVGVVRMLKDLYAGSVSETGAILQYIFQSYVCDHHNKDISQIFLQIAEQEMEHHKLLGDAIVEFGGDPNYLNSKGMMFTANNVAQCTNLKEMLQADIKSEKAAIANYEKSIENFTNESLIALIKEIIADENEHLSIFESLLVETNFWC